MKIRYQFDFDNDDSRIFTINLDDERIEATDPLPEVLPSWTNLTFEQCHHCPLNPEKHRHCPLAARLSQASEPLADILSHDEVNVTVFSNGREIRIKTTAQRATSALLGLISATSGCPHTVYMKPMARFHLPFASEEETIYRAISMYLLARYFQSNDQSQMETNLDGLTTIYKNLQTVNAATAKRLRAGAGIGDAAVNAIILLDMYAKALPAVIADSVDEVKYLFSDYL